eukprot:7378622-Prymnesium_polylepis.2
MNKLESIACEAARTRESLQGSGPSSPDTVSAPDTLDLHARRSTTGMRQQNMGRSRKHVPCRVYAPGLTPLERCMRCRRKRAADAQTEAESPRFATTMRARAARSPATKGGGLRAACACG